MVRPSTNAKTADRSDVTATTARIGTSGEASVRSAERMRAAFLFPNRVFKFDHAIILPEPVIREDKWLHAIWRV